MQTKLCSLRYARGLAALAVLLFNVSGYGNKILFAILSEIFSLLILHEAVNRLS